MCMCVCVWEECSTGDVGSVTVRYGRLSSRSTDSSSCSKLRQGACSRRSFLPNLGSGKLARRSQEEDDRSSADNHILFNGSLTRPQTGPTKAAICPAEPTHRDRELGFYVRDLSGDYTEQAAATHTVRAVYLSQYI